MPTTYTVRVVSPDGSTLLAEIANFVDPVSAGGAALEYALNVGQVGVLRLTVPASFNADLLPLDARLGVWRSINGRPPRLDGEAVFLVRAWRYTETETTVTAYHANELLQRRIIAYDAGSTYTSKTTAQPAGNLIKEFASENLGSGVVGADRDGSDTGADISAYLSIQTDLGDGTSLAAQDARRSLFDVVRDLCDASTFNASYLTAEVVAPTESTLQLRTYRAQRGVDHTASSDRPVILSPSRGSLENCVLEVDRSQEVTVAIAGGSGTESDRLIQVAINTTRLAASPLNRREVFVDMSNVNDAAALLDAAEAAVRGGRPRGTFTADVIETDGATRGVHYDLGDLLTAEFRGQQYTVRLDVVGVTVGGGRQRAQAAVRAEI